MGLHKRLRRWALAMCIGMFAVLVAGAVVTQTGSGEGCGTDWPLCNGKFIPAYTIESMIEYNHRLVTGIVGLIVVITTWLVLKHSERKDAKLYAIGSLVFTIIQAILGALAVVYPTSDVVMALHFGISLIAFTFTLLLYLIYRQPEVSVHPTGWGPSIEGKPKVSKGYRWLLWGTVIYSFIVVYTGALVSHMEAAAGCGLEFPTCNGEWLPEVSGLQGVAFAHRVAAILLFVIVAWVAHVGYRKYQEVPQFKKASLASIILIIGQILSGIWMVFSLSDENMYLLTRLLHTIIITILFGILCYMSVAAWWLRKERQDV